MQKKMWNIILRIVPFSVCKTLSLKTKNKKTNKTKQRKVSSLSAVCSGGRNAYRSKWIWFFCKQSFYNPPVVWCGVYGRKVQLTPDNTFSLTNEAIRSLTAPKALSWQMSHDTVVTCLPVEQNLKPCSHPIHHKSRLHSNEMGRGNDWCTVALHCIEHQGWNSEHWAFPAKKRLEHDGKASSSS